MAWCYASHLTKHGDNMKQYHITIYRTDNTQSTHTIEAKDKDACIDYVVSQVPEKKLEAFDIEESDKYILYVNGLAWHETYSNTIHGAIEECITLGIYDSELPCKVDIELCKFYCGSTVEYNPNYKHNS
jgi:hypothetical protein